MRYERFGVTLTVKMEAVFFSETSVTYRTTRHHILDDTKGILTTAHSPKFRTITLLSDCGQFDNSLRLLQPNETINTRFRLSFDTRSFLFCSVYDS
jgi:hypothetical protein